MAKKKSLPAHTPAAAYKPSREDIERERRYRAQSDIETLQRAEEIKRDKDRLGACKTYAKEQIKTLGKI